MKWLLVLFVIEGDATLAIPDVIEQPFDSAVQCWSVGFSMKSRNPQRIRFFDCKAFPAGAMGIDHEHDED